MSLKLLWPRSYLSTSSFTYILSKSASIPFLLLVQALILFPSVSLLQSFLFVSGNLFLQIIDNSDANHLLNELPYFTTPESSPTSISYGICFTVAIRKSHLSSHLSSPHATPHSTALLLHLLAHLLTHSFIQPTSKDARKESASRGRDHACARACGAASEVPAWVAKSAFREKGLFIDSWKEGAERRTED